MVEIDLLLLAPGEWEGFKLFYLPWSSHFPSGPLTSMAQILMVSRQIEDEWGGERADNLIMEAVASLSAVP